MVCVLLLDRRDRILFVPMIFQGVNPTVRQRKFLLVPFACLAIHRDAHRARSLALNQYLHCMPLQCREERCLQYVMLATFWWQVCYCQTFFDEPFLLQPMRVGKTQNLASQILCTYHPYEHIPFPNFQA